MSEESNYLKLSKINVNAKVEKKGKFSYLSWVWAVDQLLKADPLATWEDKEPRRFGDTVMVYCSVTCLNVTRTAYLPVMDHQNKAIKNPDAFAVNKAMQRCLAKGIALHGLGLYIYAGEDMPADDDGTRTSGPEPTQHLDLAASQKRITGICKDTTLTVEQFDEAIDLERDHVAAMSAANQKSIKEYIATSRERFD